MFTSLVTVGICFITISLVSCMKWMVGWLLELLISVDHSAVAVMTSSGETSSITEEGEGGEETETGTDGEVMVNSSR